MTTEKKPRNSAQRPSKSLFPKRHVPVLAGASRTAAKGFLGTVRCQHHCQSPGYEQYSRWQAAPARCHAGGDKRAAFPPLLIATSPRASRQSEWPIQTRKCGGRLAIPDRKGRGRVSPLVELTMPAGNRWWDGARAADGGRERFFLGWHKADLGVQKSPTNALE
jgi:hypothetical protein